MIRDSSSLLICSSSLRNIGSSLSSKLCSDVVAQKVLNVNILRFLNMAQLVFEGMLAEFPVLRF
mgnify:CR=1 FL=1